MQREDSATMIHAPAPMPSISPIPQSSGSGVKESHMSWFVGTKASVTDPLGLREVPLFYFSESYHYLTISNNKGHASSVDERRRYECKEHIWPNSTSRSWFIEGTQHFRSHISFFFLCFIATRRAQVEESNAVYSCFFMALTRLCSTRNSLFFFSLPWWLILNYVIPCHRNGEQPLHLALRSGLLSTIGHLVMKGYAEELQKLEASREPSSRLLFVITIVNKL